jgi:hypothetical protein
MVKFVSKLVPLLREVVVGKNQKTGENITRKEPVLLNKQPCLREVFEEAEGEEKALEAPKLPAQPKDMSPASEEAQQWAAEMAIYNEATRIYERSVALLKAAEDKRELRKQRNRWLAARGGYHRSSPQ